MTFRLPVVIVSTVACLLMSRRRPALRPPPTCSIATRCRRFGCSSTRATSTSCARGTARTSTTSWIFSGGTCAFGTRPSARGAASAATPSKPALRIDFDRYTTGQRFLGLKSLTLDNLWQHGSFVAESTTMAFFERMGQPAPRESFCRLYINNVLPRRVRAHRAVDNDFLARALGENTGISVLVSASGAVQRRATSAMSSLDYKRRFQAQNHELESDAILYSPIRDLFREVNQPDDRSGGSGWSSIWICGSS